MDVAGLLRLNIRRRAPGQVYVDCPICGDRRGKMNLNTAKDLWRCNYCGEGGGMLSLYLKLSTHLPSPIESHTAAHTRKQGVFRWWVPSLLSACVARYETSARSGQKSILCMGRGNVGEKCRALKQSRAWCAALFQGVAAPQGCAALLYCTDDTACHRCDEGRREKFVDRSVVLSLMVWVVSVAQGILLWLQRCVF